jgi:hypothetical protein
VIDLIDFARNDDIRVKRLNEAKANAFKQAGITYFMLDPNNLPSEKDLRIRLLNEKTMLA